MRRPLWCRAFLVLLETETNGEIALAAQRAGVNRSTVYYRCRMDATFKRDLLAVYDRLEAAHVERCLRRPAPQQAATA